MRALIVRSLDFLRKQDTRLGQAMDDLLKGHDNVARNLATDPNGNDIVPANVATVVAQHLGAGQIDIAITDDSPILRSIEYHLEYDTDPSFTNPRGRVLGPWRTGEVTLPNGTWYFRAYSQYPHGGPPSAPIAHPVGIVVTGSSATALFAAQGSGTGKPSTGGGQGSGKVLNR